MSFGKGCRRCGFVVVDYSSSMSFGKGCRSQPPVFYEGQPPCVVDVGLI